LGGSVPSRKRTIRPSALCLRYIRKISPLWRFSNLRKLSTIHPTCGLCAPKNKFLRILSLGPPTRSQPFAEAIWRYYPGYSPFGSWRARSRLLGSCTASSRLSATRTERRKLFRRSLPSSRLMGSWGVVRSGWPSYTEVTANVGSAVRAPGSLCAEAGTRVAASCSYPAPSCLCLSPRPIVVKTKCRPGD
jgi:hypothetical protein